MTAQRSKKGLRRKPRRGEEDIRPSLTDEACGRLRRNLRVRRRLPEGGRLHIDRQLPFLCVHRQSPDREDAGTRSLVSGEASHLIAPGAPRLHHAVSHLVSEVVRTLSAEFGAFLIVEIWAASDGGRANDPAVPTVLPTFRVHVPDEDGLVRTVETLERRLKRIKIQKHGVRVEVVRAKTASADGLPPLLKVDQAQELNCSWLGLEVPPVYRKPSSHDEFPLILRSLRHSLGLALRQTFFEFMRSRTTHRPPHFHSLGRRAMVKAVWEVDEKLAAVSNQFDYLLQLTPVNTSSAWKKFQRDRFERVPEFHYRPLPMDPTRLKRDLYKIPIERVEDPVLQRLFQEKQEELELKLTMLRDRDTARFLPESLQLFGGVHDDLLQLALAILGQPSRRDGQEPSPSIDAPAFAARVEEEFELYRQAYPAFRGKVTIAADVSGLIVSRGQLLVNSDLNVTPMRVEALLAHEVGTHMVTYYNGKAQPFKQLYSGLAGYEELQEGLAVLSEYLVGGLSTGRMRQLAARVVAVRNLTDGASFVENFRSLAQDHGFTQRVAYNVVMRIHRGGGFTKDAVYLRGLKAILDYVQAGGELDPLLVGKMAVEHIPIIKELQYRKVLSTPPILPRYLQDPTAVERLQGLRGGSGTVVDLMSDEARVGS